MIAFRLGNIEFLYIMIHLGERTWLAIVLQKAKQIQDFGPTSGIRASRGTLASLHEDASENGTATQLNQTTTTTTHYYHNTIQISNSQLVKKEALIYGFGEEHYLNTIDNDVWEVIVLQNSCCEKGKRKALETILYLWQFPRNFEKIHEMDDAKKFGKL
ncbi:hypothetical protein Tco_0380896 [Tanacetum coccineum]